jgi:hypothetical protein
LVTLHPADALHPPPTTSASCRPSLAKTKARPKYKIVCFLFLFILDSRVILSSPSQGDHIAVRLFFAFGDSFLLGTFLKVVTAKMFDYM